MEEWKPTLKKYRRLSGGVLFVLTLLFTSLSGFIVLSVVYLPGFLLGLSSAQWIFDTLTSLWFAFAVGIYELIYDVKIVIQGDVRNLNKNRCTLFIMNHRTRLDWLFFFSIQARYASLRRFKIALKDEIRHIPGAGWAMQAAQFLFLKRKWQIDKNRVDVTLRHYQQSSLSPQLLFFPEGTDFQGISRQKSKDYAEENELDDYHHVLHPRTLGFTSVVSTMKACNNLDQIVDVTIAYPRTILQRETDLVTGNIPREVVFTIQCYDIDDVPTDNEPKLIKWLEERWHDKEEFLKCFYSNKQYSDENGYTVEQNIEIERDTRLYMIGALVFWSLFAVINLYYLVFSYMFRMIYLGGCVTCIFLSTFVGFETLFNKF